MDLSLCRFVPIDACAVTTVLPTWDHVPSDVFSRMSGDRTPPRAQSERDGRELPRQGQLGQIGFRPASDLVAGGRPAEPEPDFATLHWLARCLGAKV